MEFLIPGVIATIIVGIAIFLWWLGKNDDYWKKRGVPFQPRMNIFTALKLITSKPLHEILLDSYKKYGRVYGGFEFRKPTITICEPDLLRDILVKDFHVFHSRREVKIGDTMIDKMISILRGEDWKRVRTIMTPAFTSKRMRQMSHIINESSQTIIETIGKYADRREPIECRKIFGAFSMDVIANAAFATKIDSHNDPDNIFVRHVNRIFTEQSFIFILTFLIIPKRITRKYRLGALSSMDFFKDVILQVIKKRKEIGKRYDDMLQLLLDAQDELSNENSKVQANSRVPEDETDQFGSVTNSEAIPRLKYNKLSEDELVAQCVLFFMVGYETTASTLSFMAYCLAINPECQEKLIKEVDDAFEKHNELNYDVVRDMKYLDYVVSETLRMYPVGTRGERMASEDYKLANTGIIIEKGMIVGFNIHAMHYDPELFVNPDKFDPERFKPENVSHHQYAYLPFGAGPRNCLGMRFALLEIKLCMSNILRYYKFIKAPNTKIPLEFRKGQGLISAKEIPLLIEKRNH